MMINWENKMTTFFVSWLCIVLLCPLSGAIKLKKKLMEDGKFVENNMLKVLGLGSTM